MPDKVEKVNFGQIGPTLIMTIISENAVKSKLCGKRSLPPINTITQDNTITQANTIGRTYS